MAKAKLDFEDQPNGWAATTNSIFSDRDGILYTVDLRVEKLQDGELVLVGTIHDNATAQFDLLEERLPLKYQA